MEKVTDHFHRYYDRILLYYDRILDWYDALTFLEQMGVLFGLFLAFFAIVALYIIRR